MILNVDGEEGQSIPLIVDSPHSGVIYPSDFNHQAEFPKLRQAEDSYVDELYNYVSKILCKFIYYTTYNIICKITHNAIFHIISNII